MKPLGLRKQFLRKSDFPSFSNILHFHRAFPWLAYYVTGHPILFLSRASHKQIILAVWAQSLTLSLWHW